VSATNKVGEGPLSVEIYARAASLPGQLSTPERTASVVVSGSPSTTSITVRWYQSELLDTGGAPLTDSSCMSTNRLLQRHIWHLVLLLSPLMGQTSQRSLSIQ